MRYSRLLTVVALACVSAVSFAQAPASKGDKGGGSAKTDKTKKNKTDPVTPEEKDAATRRTERLFGSDEPLEFTLTADFKATFKNRDTLNVKTQKATLTVKDSSGNPVAIPIEIAPRGHFRRRSDVCNFPPIKLIFADSGKKGTPFGGQKSLKLGTHCNQKDKEYAEIPVREYAAYETLNMLTDWSYKARLAKVTYVQTGDEKDAVTKYGLLIEDESDMAKRNGGRIFTARGGSFADMDPQQTATMTVFDYYLGNTDWSLYSLHNIRLVIAGDRYMPVPYDFDWSGIVYARYAKPDPRLGIPTVQDRLFRGPCLTPNDLAPILAKYTEHRQDIKALYAGLPLDDGYRRRAMDYIDDFYKVISDQRQVKRELIEPCAGRVSS
jgi:hypothetical protein